MSQNTATKKIEVLESLDSTESSTINEYRELDNKINLILEKISEKKKKIKNPKK